MKPYRVGLIGTGYISRIYAQALRRIAEGELAGICSRQRESAERFASEFGAELATDSLDALLESVDVVCVNTPNALHAEQAIRAAEAGRHVIVEKPLAVSLEQGEAIVGACARAGVGLAYAEELPFAPKFAHARELLTSGALGDALYVTQREAHAGPHTPWFYTRDAAGGGVLMDMACHSVECVRWLLGKPAVKRVSAEISRTLHRARTELDDHAVLQLRFEGGVTATCESSWALHGGMQSKLEVWGSEGYLDVDLLQQTGVRVYTANGHTPSELPPGWSTPVPDWLEANGYPQELSHFLRAFREGTEPLESGRDGVKVLEILCAAYTSARSGRAIELPYRPPPVERAVDLWLGTP